MVGLSWCEGCGRFVQSGHSCLRFLRERSPFFFGRRRLDDVEVAEVRAVYGRGRASQQALADRFGVSRHTISQVIYEQGAYSPGCVQDGGQ